MPPNKTAHFLTLDAARGIAALTVFLFHLTTFVFPDVSWPSFFTLSASYLAVDLFFLMSGIVLTRAYAEQIASGKMPFWSFIGIRIVRLYPLYLAGLLLGVGYVLLKIVINHEVDMSFPDAVRSLLLNMLFLPDIWNAKGIFPFNPAAWSLSLEWFINILFGIFLVRQNNKILTVVSLVGATCLLFFGMKHHGLDLGWSAQTFPGGGARILFSFTLGIVMYRLLQAGAPVKTGRTTAVLLLPALVLALVPPLFLRSVWHDFALVYVFFPLFCALAIISPPVKALTGISVLLGQISYALYILHTPLILWFAGIWKLFMHTEPQNMAAVSFPLIVCMVVFSSYMATI